MSEAKRDHVIFPSGEIEVSCDFGAVSPLLTDFGRVELGFRS